MTRTRCQFWASVHRSVNSPTAIMLSEATNTAAPSAVKRFTRDATMPIVQMAAA